MEDVAEFPSPLLGYVTDSVLVVRIDATDEVDDLVVLRVARGSKERIGDRGVRLRECLPGSTDDRVDRPVRGGRRTEFLAGFPTQGRAQRDAGGVHRDQAV